LHIELGLLSVRRSRERHDAELAGAHPLHEGLDGPTLAGGVARFKHDDYARSLVNNTVLEPAQFGLQLP
jgi:hypothetical protein